MSDIRLHRAYYHTTPHVLQKVQKYIHKDSVGRFTRRAFIDKDGRVMMVGWFV